MVCFMEGRQHLCEQGQVDFTLSGEPDAGLNPRTMRSGPEPKPKVRRSAD